MPLQELSPQPRSTALDQLGGVINNFAERQAHDSRQDQLLAQQRSQQLQDVQSARNYSNERFDYERSARLTDEQKLAMLRVRQAMEAEAVKEGLLSINEVDDEAKVKVAIQEMARRGLLEKYKPLLESGALRVGDVQNPLAVDTAIQSNADRITGENTAARAAKANALQFGQAAADRALRNQQGLQQSIAALEDQLKQPAPQPSDADILNRARQLYLVNNPKERVAPTETGKLAGEIQQAAKELRDQAYLARKDEVARIQQQVAMLRYQLSESAKNDATLANQGFFANPSSTQPAQAPAPIGRGLLGGTNSVAAPEAASDFMEKLRQIQIQNQPAPSSPASSAALIDNPTNDPTIEAGNVAIKQREAQNVQSQLNDASAELQAIQGKLATVQGGGTNIPLPMYPMMGQPIPQQRTGPIGAAQEASALLQAKAAAEAKVQALRAQLMGPTASAVTPPAINTPTFSTPANAFAAPAGLVQAPAWWKSGG